MLLLTISCSTIFELPDPVLPVPINIKVRIHPLDYDNWVLPQGYYDAALKSYNLRCIVEARTDDNLCAARWVKVRNSVPANDEAFVTIDSALPADNYTLLAWIDFVNKDASDKYYDTQDLQFIDTKDPYVPYTPARDAFSWAQAMNLLPYEDIDKTYNATLNAYRVFALYRIVANDVRLFKQLRYSGSEDSDLPMHTAAITPEGWVAGAFDVVAQAPAIGGLRQMSYDYPVRALAQDTTTVLVQDFVIALEPWSYYRLRFDVVNMASGDTMKRDQYIDTLVVRRNHVTERISNYLTGDYSGGIGIDDRFSHDSVIWVK
jgi:hypothetical protein